jgi:uncharacterized YigZ family protein
MLIIPLEPARAEIVVVNSRFIASLECVESVSAARAFIGRMESEFPDATHNVSAFIIGGGNATTDFCSDDGEPSGTSGRPLLAVLKGSGLGNVAVVVTRYFGGTLLGTGGLVRAYTAAGKAVLTRTRRAALVELARVELDLPYALLERERLIAAEAGATVVEENFAETVRVLVDVPTDTLDRFSSRLAEFSSGRVKPKRVETRIGRRPLASSA